MIESEVFWYRSHDNRAYVNGFSFTGLHSLKVCRLNRVRLKVFFYVVDEIWAFVTRTGSNLDSAKVCPFNRITQYRTQKLSNFMIRPRVFWCRPHDNRSYVFSKHRTQRLSNMFNVNFDKLHRVTWKLVHDLGLYLTFTVSSVLSAWFGCK